MKEGSGRERRRNKEGGKEKMEESNECGHTPISRGKKKEERNTP